MGPIVLPISVKKKHIYRNLCACEEDFQYPGLINHSCFMPRLISVVNEVDVNIVYHDDFSN